MKCAKIISDSIIKTFWCKKCNRASNVLYKTSKDSYCECCVPKELSNNYIAINQNRDEKI